MMYKWIGVILIIGGCTGTGFSMAAAHLREERQLRSLIGALDLMECELQYRLTPLPDLCRMAGEEIPGPIGEFFSLLHLELTEFVHGNVSLCVEQMLAKNPALAPSARELLSQLGQSLGRFDQQGQLKGLERARATCRRKLEYLGKDREVRLRSYQTLGLCAGAALAILLV